MKLFALLCIALMLGFILFVKQSGAKESAELLCNQQLKPGMTQAQVHKQMVTSKANFQRAVIFDQPASDSELEMEFVAMGDLAWRCTAYFNQGQLSRTQVEKSN